MVTVVGGEMSVRFLRVARRGQFYRTNESGIKTARLDGNLEVLGGMTISVRKTWR